MLPRSAEDRQAKPVRMDGNTVQLDEEMLAMNRTLSITNTSAGSRRNDQGAKQSDTRQGLIIKGDVSKHDDELDTWSRINGECSFR